jgi:predicted RNA-binding Zn ribbon-like protein
MKKVSKSKFIFNGNHRCLDFINTKIVEKGHPVDLITNFADLVDWLTQAEILKASESREAIRRWNGKPEAEHTLEQAKALRTVLLNMVQRIVDQKPIEQSSIGEINKVLSTRIGYPGLVKVHGGFETRFHVDSDQPSHLIASIAESASDLLCNADFSLIKKCENPACVLYFYDTTKNHARRWCSMNICGNRIKVAAHYRRHRDN